MQPYKILVLYYTQTGQLEQIVDSITSPLQQIAEIEYGIIEPVIPFPFPWNTFDFFNAMRECVLQKPVAVKIKGYEDWKDVNFDLIVLGYQPWFLHPSLPTSGFLQSDFSTILKNKKVITITGSRNMWLNAHECVKAHLYRLGAQHVGHILFQDKHDNLTSLLTVIRWSFKGQKEGGGLLPDAGVSDADIKAANRFSPIIQQSLEHNDWQNLQQHLLTVGAVEMIPGLVVLEKKGIKNFRFWAKYIREKGEPQSPERKGRVKLFSRLLITGIFILTPISTFKAKLKMRKPNNKLKKEVEYFEGVSYLPGKI